MADEPNPQDEALVQAVFDDPDDEPGDIIAFTEPGERAEGVEDAAEPRGFTRHALYCGPTSATSQPTFKAPGTTGHLWLRVAFYDAAGVRMYLAPWRDKGTLNSYGSITHVETVIRLPRRARRAVCIARFPGFYDIAGSMWGSC
jgi:hypothetical protein